MMLVSNTIEKYFSNKIVRINLAWFVDLESIKKEVKKHSSVFVDIPLDRKKPPQRLIDLEVEKYVKNEAIIKYVAISNCNLTILKKSHEKYQKQIVPKIEEERGIQDISKICDFLKKTYSYPRLVMIDQEDMYENLNSANLVIKSIKKIKKVCEKKECYPIIAHGIVFDVLTDEKIGLM